jgi:hypothetical protein
MARELPVVCSLEAADLEARLAEIADLGAEALLGGAMRDGRHLLRFRSTPGVRRRLEEIVAAEAECCAFLDLALGERGGELVLTIAAPEAGQPTADALAAAFEANLGQGRS